MLPKKTLRLLYGDLDFGDNREAGVPFDNNMTLGVKTEEKPKKPTLREMPEWKSILGNKIKFEDSLEQAIAHNSAAKILSHRDSNASKKDTTTAAEKTSHNLMSTS